MKLSLKALATNRVNGSVTAFKTYEVIFGGRASGYWFINDKGEKQLAHKNTVRDWFSDPKKQYSFEICLQENIPEETIKKQIDNSIRNSLKPGGDIWMSSKFGSIADSFGFVKGGLVKGATINKGEIMAQVGKSSDTPRPKEVEHDAAVAELDKHLPAYRRSDKGFGLVDSIEWLGKLNAAHQVDCQKYEGIIENLMDAFGVNTYDELAKFASNLKKSADIIDAIRKK